MNLPSMWRDELFHPLTAHFPIALLIVGGLFWFLGIGLKKWRSPLWTTGSLVLILAAPLSWAAVVTGDIAHDTVSRVLCDPFVMHDHEEWAEKTAWLASLVATLLVVRFFQMRGQHPTTPWSIPQKVSTTLITLGIAINMLMISYVGHLGATLVYQQGAAVHKPSPQCEGFE